MTPHKSAAMIAGEISDLLPDDAIEAAAILAAVFGWHCRDSNIPRELALSTICAALTVDIEMEYASTRRASRHEH